MNSPSLTSKKSILYLTVPILFLVLFLLLPVLYTFYLSLTSKTGSLTFNNYISILDSSLNRYFLYWTIQQAIITTIFCVIIGLGGSYILAYYDIPAKQLIRNILTVPFLIPSIAVLIGFLTIYPINIIFSYSGIILANLFYNLPLMIRLTEVGWTSINPEYEIIAKSLKMSKVSYFIHVQLPHLLPFILTASLLTFIYCFNSFAIVLVLGGVQYQTLEVRIYTLVLRLFEYNQASALAIIQLLVNIGVIITYLYFTFKYESKLTTFSYMKSQTKAYSSRSIHKKIFSSLIILFYSGLIFLICMLPLIGVFYKSLMSKSDFSLISFENLFNYQIKNFIGLTSQNMIVNSLMYAACVLLISILLALLLNFGLNYKTTTTGNPIFGMKSITNLIVILPLVVSAITLIYSIFSLYRNTILFSQTSYVIIIAQVLLAFPFANRIIATARASVNEEMLQVGRSLGLSRIQIFFKIELPLLLPSILVAGIFSFAISLGEFASTNFVARGNTATIPIGIYRLVTTRHLPEAAAFSSILILLTLGIFILLERIGKGTVDYKI